MLFLPFPEGAFRVVAYPGEVAFPEDACLVGPYRVGASRVVVAHSSDQTVVVQIVEVLSFLGVVVQAAVLSYRAAGHGSQVVVVLGGL